MKFIFYHFLWIRRILVLGEKKRCSHERRRVLYERTQCIHADHLELLILCRSDTFFRLRVAYPSSNKKMWTSDKNWKTNDHTLFPILLGAIFFRFIFNSFHWAINLMGSLFRKRRLRKKIWNSQFFCLILNYIFTCGFWLEHELLWNVNENKKIWKKKSPKREEKKHEMINFAKFGSSSLITISLIPLCVSIGEKSLSCLSHT